MMARQVILNDIEATLGIVPGFMEGIDIHVELACGPTGYGIDTKDDLIKVKKELKK